MDLHRNYSILDIGCGSGIMAIPLAGMVKKITALDILKERTEIKRINNIRILNRDWTEVIPEKDLPLHDIVLASRCLSGSGITDSLWKIDRMAKRACYITWRAGQSDNYELDTYKVLGWEFHPHPEYAVIWNMLYGLGIRANLEIFESIQEERYPNIEQAIVNLCRGEIVDDQTKDKMINFVKTNFRIKNGYLYHRSKLKWSLIWWRKPSRVTAKYFKPTLRSDDL